MPTLSRRPWRLHGRANRGCSTWSALPAVSATTASGPKKATCSGPCASFAFTARCRSYWGTKDVSTTMIYTHALNRGGRGVKSPLDRVTKNRNDIELRNVH